jgi:hypothetical protein
MTKLLTFAAQTEDDTTDVLEVPKPMTGFIDAWGTWDGASIALQRSVDEGDTWHAIGVALSADGEAQALELPKGHYRLALTDAGASTSLGAQFEVPELPPG